MIRKIREVILNEETLGEGVKAAGATATRYITSITGLNGITVHDVDDVLNYINITSGLINLVTGGVSRLKAYVENNVAKLRIGDASAGHIILSPSGMSVRDSQDEVAKFGSSGAQVGKDDEARTVITNNATKWYADEDTLAGEIHYGMTTHSFYNADADFTETGSNYGFNSVDFEKPPYNATSVEVGITGYLSRNGNSGPTGWYSVDQTFELDDLTAYDDYYYQQFHLNNVMDEGTQGYYLTFIVKNTRLIKAYFGFRQYTPGGSHTQDQTYYYECGIYASTIITIAGAEVSFGESANNDNRPDSVNIHNALRLRSYGEMDLADQYAITVGDGEDDENRHNSYGVTRDGYTEGSHCVQVPDLTDYVQEMSAAGLTPSSSDSLWINALIGVLCHLYPNRQDCVFEGTLKPNSRGFYKIFIYDTDEINESTDPSARIPKYCIGEFMKWSNNIFRFYTNNGTFTGRNATW